MSDQKKYQQIVQTPEFQQLLKAKQRFMLPTIIFFVAFFIFLPIMTSYTTILNRPAIGSITWAWIIAFLQFIMTWVLSGLYSRKSANFDHMADQLKAKQLPLFEKKRKEV
ncbi:membrane protein [Heyndrickxia sporothermodurans]|nr:membrane protein [Heyndrickxia sporothermodurans]